MAARLSGRASWPRDAIPSVVSSEIASRVKLRQCKCASGIPGAPRQPDTTNSKSDSARTAPDHQTVRPSRAA
jgi:hypothetical protein